MLEAIKRLENSPEFVEYKKDNPDAFLVHVFYMLDEANKNAIQIGYYSKASDKITTFIIDKESITKNPEAEVFKEQETIMNPINIDGVKIGVDEALKIAEELQKEKYKEHSPVKQIAILQHLPVGQVWNVTFVTRAFKTLNVKIDSNTGKVVSDKLLSIIEFGK